MSIEYSREQIYNKYVVQLKRLRKNCKREKNRDKKEFRFMWFFAGSEVSYDEKNKWHHVGKKGVVVSEYCYQIIL